MFSVGVLYATQEFLQLARSQRITVSAFHQSFPRYNYVRCTDILDTALRFQWVNLEPQAGTLHLTASGMAVASESQPSLRLRSQLRDMLLSEPPSWIGLVYRGRSSVRRYANRDTVQCFQEAGLLTEDDPSVATWWDDIANPSRLKRERRLLEIGRRGEWLSMEYEERRVGCRPHWVSLDSTDAGYDLISLVGRDSVETLVIEVKASEEPWDIAQFHLSRNEWVILSSQKHAVIHLWCLASTFALHRQLDMDTVAGHVPGDTGAGQWETVRIPFQVAGPGSPIGSDLSFDSVGRRQAPN